ncbi:MAG: protein translocase subunit SecD [bacterium]
MKLNRFLLWFIIFVTAGATLLSFPTVPVKFQIGDFKFDRTIKGPNFQDLFGNNVQKNVDIKLGLDLQGGTFVSLKADMSDVAEADKTAKLEATRKVIENRVNQFGLSEANIYGSINGSEYKINVELPGSGKDIDNEIKILQETAKLEFYTQKANPEDLSSIPQEQITTAIVLQAQWDKSNVTGADLKTANAQALSSQSSSTITKANQQEVALVFTTDGANKFNELASTNRGKPIAIVLDGNIISSPRVADDFGLTSGASNTVVINGLSLTEADNLAIQLRGGALPTPVELIEQKTIEATLGKDALNKSIIAGLIGIFLVICFMIFLYKVEGLIASVALVIYTLITLSLYKLIPITLTLPGIAGFILSVGIAVDANVLIFERMNEEVRKGKTKTQALKLGFERAWTSIRDSNLSTLITCTILYFFGAVVVKSFAINLAIGVLISLFTAVSVTRQLLLVTVLKKENQVISVKTEPKEKKVKTKFKFSNLFKFLKKGKSKDVKKTKTNLWNFKRK